ncbi:MAG: hypothetical protein ACTSRE_13685 [Promethearchaeota archaeon]
MGRKISETSGKKRPKELMVVLLVLFTLLFSIILQIELKNIPLIISGGS